MKAEVYLILSNQNVFMVLVLVYPGWHVVTDYM